MNLTTVDWAIVAGILAVIVSGVFYSQRQMRSVADFLAANRTAGRYMISVAQGIAGLGAISVVGFFQMNYEAGFAMTWWGFTMAIVVLIITVSGWVIYRFRETRALTMAQFFEMRYSRKFRIFAGIVAFVSGIINFGIFPGVGARFFMYFCGLPDTYELLGIECSTFATTMLVLLGTSIFFVFAGGQIAVIVTDFVQGVFVNVVFVIIIIYFLRIISFENMFEAMRLAPENKSLINPFKTSHVEDFNLWFFMVGICIAFYNTLSWQGTQGYNASAKTAHEAKMGGVLSNWRGIPQAMLLLIVPVAAFTILNHPELFRTETAAVQGVLDGISSEMVRNEVRVPLVLTHLLPVGMMGAFAAVMLTAFISTHDSYLHSWGSIFIQDVVLQFRREPLTPKQHILLLRCSILGVAVFIFVFSLLYEPAEYIQMFFAITGAIYAGGSGSVIIGGLYWKKGTTGGAWCAMIAGAVIAVGSIVGRQIYGDAFPYNGQIWTFFAMVSAVALYFIVSLESGKLHTYRRFVLTRDVLVGLAVLMTVWLVGFLLEQAFPKFPFEPVVWIFVALIPAIVAYAVVAQRIGVGRDFNMDRLLHHGKYAIGGEHEEIQQRVNRGWRVLGMGKEFTRGDKIIYIATYTWTFAWVTVFIIGTLYNLIYGASDRSWMTFWFTYLVINTVISLVVVVWFTIGGVRDLKHMFKALSTMVRDDTDDGLVRVAPANETEPEA